MADEDLMFSMDGVDSGGTKRGGSLDDPDIDEEDSYYICPITDDPVYNKASEICNYLKNLIHNEQYSSSAPSQTSFNVQKEKEQEAVSFDTLSERGRTAWKNAIRKAKAMPDPWAEFHLEEIEKEPCTRYRYNAVTGQWVEDEVFIKMASQPFGRGAMRECYRTKKLSNFSHSHNWKSASNYVAKRYLMPVDRDVYFEDVDIMQMCIVEMKNRPDKPLFHLEHYIEGKYIKYNSNSGFVRDDNIRLTPQAFSHFSFERSAHQLIVVDIQGVGDLYTDPQIHTECGTDFGDGNLGLRGMALFFHSHLCNKICKSMGLTPFDISPKEKAVLDCTNKLLESAKTVLRGCEEKCGSPRVRTISTGRLPPLLSRLSESSCPDDMSDGLFDSPLYSPAGHYPESYGKSPLGWSLLNDVDAGAFEAINNIHEHRDSDGGDSGYPSERRSEGDDMEHRDRASSLNSRRCYESDEDSIRRVNTKPSYNHHRTLSTPPLSPISPIYYMWRRGLTEEKWNVYHASRSHVHRPSCVAVEVERLNALVLEKKIGRSNLGKVHLAMVRYHEGGRFCEKDEEWDRDSAVFHLEHAAMCGELEAIVALGLMHFQIPHHILTDITLEDTDKNRKKGFTYLLQAAEAGDRPSMIFVSRAFDSGVTLPPDRSRDWKEAVRWYNMALNMTDYDEGGEYDGMQDEPHYLLLAREAEMYMEGGFGLEPDPQKAGELFTEAADAAMEALKGRLANQYYMKAEEAWSLMEE
ncbi:UNVERIFIED_CONTAM: hypothetical protein FKN15_042038 [Acipenser sinensis]